MRLASLLPYLSLVVISCSKSRAPSATGSGGTTSSDTGASSVSSTESSGAGPSICATLPPVPAGVGMPSASPLYPDPKYVEVGGFAAQVKTACVDTSALPSHSKLDAWVPKLLAESGLTSAPLGDCACDWTLAFGAAPSLSGNAEKTLADGGMNAEIYAEVTSADAELRAHTALYARTERGGLYALRAALATVKADPGGAVVPASTIVDFPDIAARGFIDGIYKQIGGGDGTFNGWPSAFTPASRSEILRLMARLRGNTFIYGPKCDSFGRGGTCAGQASTPNWTSTYQNDFGQASSIITLAAEADANLVDLYWAMNPLIGVNWNDPTGAPLTAAKKKIDELRSMGVHHFAMFIDDASPIPTTAGNAAALMNGTNAYLKTLDPGDHLLVVTWAYNGYWATSWQQGFGAALDKDVEVMWTGPGIESCTVSASDMGAPNANYQRTLSIWDNWPSHTCDPPWPPHATPAKMSGRSGDLAPAIHGYYSNPVISEAGGDLSEELSHLGPIFDFAWSPSHYGTAVDASYARWATVLPAWQAFVHPCSNTDCTVKGASYIGFACDPNDANGILFCDTYEKNCVTKLSCPKGCSVQNNAMDTCNE